MGDGVIKLTGIGMRWNDREVLSDVNLSVDRGDFLAITGPNGGGKSTLLRIILKLLKPSAGTVEYFDRDGNSCRNLHIGYLPQKNMIDSRFPITVREVISSGLLGRTANECDPHGREVEDMLRRVELTSHADNPIGALSGGQVQRTLLGRALISRPAVLVLDEPLSYLDKHFESQMYGLLTELAARTTILLVSHDMNVIDGMANRHVIVDRVLMQG